MSVLELYLIVIPLAAIVAAISLAVIDSSYDDAPVMCGIFGLGIGVLWPIFVFASAVGVFAIWVVNMASRFVDGE